MLPINAPAASIEAAFFARLAPANPLACLDSFFGAKMKVLNEDVEHHADEEEKETFKEARKLRSERLQELGEELLAKKDGLKVA